MSYCMGNVECLAHSSAKNVSYHYLAWFFIFNGVFFVFFNGDELEMSTIATQWARVLKLVKSVFL